MKKYYLFHLIVSFYFLPATSQDGASNTIENFIYNTELLKKNDKGVIIPQFNRTLNNRIEFHIQEYFKNIVESTNNIIWQSYETKTNSMLKSHVMTYFARVKLKNSNQNNEFKYLEINHYPSTDKIDIKYIWDPQKNKFRLSDGEMERRSYLPDLKELKIQDQSTKPDINDILVEYKDLMNGVNDNIIYFNKSKSEELETINKKIIQFVSQNFTTAEYVMNISFDSYYTFLSSYDNYHYYTFVVQLKLNDSNFPRFIEVFYNPTTGIVNSDYVWNNENKEFIRPQIEY